MSEPPEKKSTWGQYYAERGVSRPPQPGGARAMFRRGRDSAAQPAGEKKETSELSAELTAAIAAVTAEAAGSTAAPFIGAMHKEALAREARRLARRKLLLIGAGVLAAVVALPVVLTFLLNAAPSQEKLDAHANQIAGTVLAMYSSAVQPLMTKETVVRELESPGLGRLNYEVAVTLELRVPLYVLAQTNGTEAYRLLQHSLAEAQERAAKLKLFQPPASPPERPEMPTLLRLMHRAGETIVVRVPFTARRFGWTWRLDAADLSGRTVSRALEGLPMEKYSGTPTMIFGSPDSLLDVRQRVKLARDYVTAVNKEARERAVADAPALDTPQPAARNRSAPIMPALPDPNAPALPDPNAPATVDPNAPALIDPNAPAVRRPK